MEGSLHSICVHKIIVSFCSTVVSNVAEPLMEEDSDKEEDDLGDNGSNIFGYAKLMKEKERQKLVWVELILSEIHT